MALFSPLRHASRFPFFLTLGAALYFLGFRMYRLPARSLSEMLSSWGIDILVFTAVVMIGEVSRKHRHLSRGLFHSLFLTVFTLHFAFFYFFAEATWRRYSLLDTGPSQLLYFFTDVLPLSGLFILLASIAALYTAAWILQRLPIRSFAAFSLPIIGFLVTLISPAAPDSPVSYMQKDLHEAFSSSAVPVQHVQPPENWNTWDRPLPRELRYKKIIVFVMESITTKALEEQAALMSPATLFRRASSSAHLYTNVIASNMDSRTGMLAMLSGRFIPFEAYSEEDVSRYDHLSGEVSLVGVMNDFGYRTAFSASVTEKEAVVYDLPWTDRFTLTEDDRRTAASQGFLCLTPYEFEHSCDDRFLFPRLLQFVQANERIFLFQEFIYGHSEEYQDELKIHPLQYYSEYIESFQSELRKKGLLNETLIVIVSDHGIRLKGYETELSTYRLPLIFLHPSFTGRQNGQLFAHFDFKDILLAEASGSDKIPAGRVFAPFTGMTSSSIIGAADSDGGLTVIKDRRFRPYALRDSNTGISSEQLLGSIRSYRDQFQDLQTIR